MAYKRGEHSMSEFTPELQKKLEELRVKGEQHVTAVRAVFEKAPKEKQCPLHRCTLKADFDLTLDASWRSDGIEVVYETCTTCRNEKREEAWLIKAGVPEKLVSSSFSTFIPETSEDRTNQHECAKWALEPTGVLILRGNVGCGKTHLAISILRRHRKGRYITHANLLKQVRKGYQSTYERERLDRISESDLLIIDDFGVSHGGEDNLPIIHEIISSRIESGLPTVIVTNLSGEEILNYVGERAANRIQAALAARLVFTGKSNRVKYKQNYL